MTTVESPNTNESRLAQLAAGGCFSRSLAVAARLGLADLTADTAVSPARLAERVGVDEHALSLLLRTLSLQGVYEPNERGEYQLGEDFAQLRSDHPYSIRHLTILIAEVYDDALGALSHTVRTGRSGFRELFGASFYEHLAGNPDSERVFDEAMAELARPVAAELAHRHDFSSVRTVVDVGGGSGAMLAALLSACPHLRGVCLDRPSVCERAERGPLAGQLTFRPTDIFDEIPAGGDRYLIKNVLHDWSFASCRTLLTNVRDAMLRTRATGGDPTLLVVEPFLDGVADAPHTLFQLVVCEDGTRGLSPENFQRLLEITGLTMRSLTQLASGHNVFECAP